MPGRVPAARLQHGRARAERDITGLCCPVELSSVLRTSFERTDKELLAHLEGAARAPKPVAGGVASRQERASPSCVQERPAPCELCSCGTAQAAAL